MRQARRRCAWCIPIGIVACQLEYERPDRIALSGNGTHKVSLDKVIATMRMTGADMLTKHKETSRGGLAVNIVEC